MPVYELRQDDYLVSTDRAQLDIPYIAALLSRTYWAKNRCSEKQVLRSCENSLCFGLYENEKQIGFARVITDHVFFGYLCDVCVDETRRGRGLGKLLVRAVVECPELKGLKIMLATRDAHGLYKQFGWTALAAPEAMLELRPEKPPVSQAQ